LDSTAAAIKWLPRPFSVTEEDRSEPQNDLVKPESVPTGQCDEDDRPPEQGEGDAASSRRWSQWLELVLKRGTQKLRVGMKVAVAVQTRNQDGGGETPRSPVCPGASAGGAEEALLSGP